MKKVLQPWNVVWAVLAVLGCLVVLMPASASANKADDPATYGAWGNDPRQGASNGVSLAPFNSKTPEMTSFACLVNGSPLSEAQVSALSQIATMSLTIYNGDIDEYSFAGRDTDGSESISLWGEENYGHPTGAEGVNLYISREKDWLKRPIDSLIRDPITIYRGVNLTREQRMVGMRDPEYSTEIFEEALDDDNETKVTEALYKNENGNRYPDSKLLSAWTKHDNRIFQGSPDSSLLSSSDSNDRMEWSKTARPRSTGEEVWLSMDKTKYREKDSLDEAKAGFPLTVQEAREVASLIKDNPGKPVDIFTEKLPDGCIPANFDAGLDVQFGDIFDDPAAFLAGILISPVIDITNSLYQNIATEAWAYLFVTPHTERGDTLWDLDNECLARRGENAAGIAIRDNKLDACQNNKPLGFTKKNVKENVKDRPLFLDVANLLAWLVTGTYFVILFAAAVLFIYRGSSSQKFNLMKVAPRILLSMMIAIAAPFLIGAMITVGNWATTGMLDLLDKDGSPITSMNIMLGQTGDMMGLTNELTNSFVTAVVAIITLGATFVFFIGVTIKQIALIALIVLAPIAIFCLIVDSWRPKFMRWLKALLILILLPVIMATVLTLGVLINPILAGSASATLGAIMLIATIFGMGWIMQTGLSIAIRGKNTNVIAGMSELAGGGLQRLGALASKAHPGVGAALGVAGQGVRMGGKRLGKGDLGDKIAGSLIPEGRASGGAGEGGLPGFMRQMKMGADIGMGYRGVYGRSGRRGRRGTPYDKMGGGGGGGEGGKGGGFGVDGEGSTKEGLIGQRGNFATRRARSGLERGKAYMRTRRNIRSERLAQEGRRDWMRPSHLIPFWSNRGGRLNSFEDKTRGVKDQLGDMAKPEYQEMATVSEAEGKQTEKQVQAIERAEQAAISLAGRKKLQEATEGIIASNPDMSKRDKMTLRMKAQTMTYKQMQKEVEHGGKYGDILKDTLHSGQRSMFEKIEAQTGVVGGTKGIRKGMGGRYQITKSNQAYQDLKKEREAEAKEQEKERRSARETILEGVPGVGR